MPRWTCGSLTPGSSLGPSVPTPSPSTTDAPLVTAKEPRWVRVTDQPSAVSIVTHLPFPGTVPTNDTTPVAGARTSDTPALLVAAALISGDGDGLLLARATTHATTTRDRQLVAVAAADLEGDHDLFDALLRDHLADHPANVLAACKASQVDTIVTSRAFIEKGRLDALIAGLSPTIKIVYLEDVRPTITLGDKLRGLRNLKKPLVERKPGDYAAILFTSGSEGTPKGVVLSHRNMLANAAQAAARIDFGR